MAGKPRRGARTWSQWEWTRPRRPWSPRRLPSPSHPPASQSKGRQQGRQLQQRLTLHRAGGPTCQPPLQSPPPPLSPSHPPGQGRQGHAHSNGQSEAACSIVGTRAADSIHTPSQAAPSRFCVKNPPFRTSCAEPQTLPGPVRERRSGRPSAAGQKGGLSSGEGRGRAPPPGLHNKLSSSAAEPRTSVRSPGENGALILSILSASTRLALNSTSNRGM